MRSVVRIVPAVGALGVVLVIIGGLSVVSSALAASSSPGAGPGNVLAGADPTAESTFEATESPQASPSVGVTKTAGVTRTVDPTPESTPTDTPVPTLTNTVTPTGTNTVQVRTHTPVPSETNEASTSTPESPTEPAGSPSPESTVLGIEAPVGIVLPTTGGGAADAGSDGAGLLAGAVMIAAGLAMVAVAARSRRTRA